VKAVDIGPEDTGVRAALWAELLRDPLLELRMASMRPPAAGKQNPALPSVQAPDIVLTNILSNEARRFEINEQGGTMRLGSRCRVRRA
jgi:hypothetical protein